MLLRISYRLLFWLIIMFGTMLPIALSRHGIELYLLPQLEIGFVYFAAIMLPLHSWQIFLYGLFVDILHGNPIGMTSTFILVIFIAVRFLRHYLLTRDFNSIMLGFTLVALAYAVIKHLVFMVIYGQNYSYSLAAINCGITIGSYPLLYWGLIYLLRLYSHD